MIKNSLKFIRSYHNALKYAELCCGMWPLSKAITIAIVVSHFTELCSGLNPDNVACPRLDDGDGAYGYGGSSSRVGVGVVGGCFLMLNAANVAGELCKLCGDTNAIGIVC